MIHEVHSQSLHKTNCRDAKGLGQPNPHPVTNCECNSAVWGNRYINLAFLFVGGNRYGPRNLAVLGPAFRGDVNVGDFANHKFRNVKFVEVDTDVDGCVG